MAQRPFSFSMLYTMDVSGLWSAILDLFTVFAILVLTGWIVHAFMYLKSYGGGSVDLYMGVNIAANLYIAVVLLLFTIALIFSLYCLFGFK
jgi:hypothetical protein